ncbi:MAG: hypothetical protein EBU90_13895 [Proteobacteria bacterium]|nr:hypothetical protein [Pseudomonadota bacterium]NBP15894.1 hypothetical protein [bacterium]
MHKFLLHKDFLKAFLCFLMGMVAYSVYQEWIIITVQLSMPGNNNKKLVAEKKELTYFFCKANQWHTERSQLLWSKDELHNLSAVIEQWITLGKVEGLLDKKIKLQTATISTDKKTAYLSFNQSPLTQEQAIYEKLRVIEGLLKTVKAQNFTVTQIYFLNNHQPLQDAHLDFEEPWPLDGFTGQ